MGIKNDRREPTKNYNSSENDERKMMINEEGKMLIENERGESISYTRTHFLVAVCVVWWRAQEVAIERSFVFRANLSTATDSPFF